MLSPFALVPLLASLALAQKNLVAVGYFPKIDVLEFQDSSYGQNGILSLTSSFPFLNNSTWINVFPDGKRISTGYEYNPGVVNVWGVTRSEGRISFQPQNSTFTGGPNVFHSLAHKKNILLNANYFGGNVTIHSFSTPNENTFIVNESTQFSFLNDTLGPDPARQVATTPIEGVMGGGNHVHMAVTSPYEKDSGNGFRIYVPDLGTDRLHVLRVTENPLTVSQLSYLRITPGAGARHITFHPNQKVAYLVAEMASELFVLQLNGDAAPIILKTISLLQPGIVREFNGIGSAMIHLSKDAKNVYVTNRNYYSFDGSIAILDVDVSGMVTGPKKWVSSGGKVPRTMDWDSDDRFMAVANQWTGNAVIFERVLPGGDLRQVSSVQTSGNVTHVAWLN